MTPTTDELRALVERLESTPPYYSLCVKDGIGVYTAETVSHEAASALRLWIAEREREEQKAQDDYNAGRALEEYGGQAEGDCLYDLYAENRQFASQEPPRRNKNGGWDYSV